MKMTDELMERRARLIEAWMERVRESQEGHGGQITFWGAGTTIDSKGTLRMIAFAPNSWNQLWELECRKDGEVTFIEVER